MEIITVAKTKYSCSQEKFL